MLLRQLNRAMDMAITDMVDTDTVMDMVATDMVMDMDTATMVIIMAKDLPMPNLKL